MTDAIRELKVRAEILHRQAQSGDSPALKRLRVLPELRRSPGAAIRRRHCLTAIAAELGFPGWPQAKRALAGEGPVQDFGDLLCPSRCAVHFNHWYKGYDEAAEMRKTCQGYLLAYRRQYLVVDGHYIETLGLDPGDAGWAAMGYDWARPRSVAARTRLYAKLVAAMPRES
jgi:hypothetical protein